ncbi:uncharacterized protein LAESUDRAFT_491763, partial [Laetiporus sulphureus 93-53]
VERWDIKAITFCHTFKLCPYPARTFCRHNCNFSSAKSVSTSTGAGASFGTQSTPLEATEQEKPMGVSSVSGENVEALLDAQQR